MQFKVLERSYINDSIVEAGAIVTLPEGVEPGPNLEPVEEPKPARGKSADA